MQSLILIVQSFDVLLESLGSFVCLLWFMVPTVVFILLSDGCSQFLIWLAGAHVFVGAKAQVMVSVWHLSSYVCGSDRLDSVPMGQSYLSMTSLDQSLVLVISRT